MMQRKVKPHNESRKKMRPYRRDAFYALLARVQLRRLLQSPLQNHPEK
jgi:hypothetical protein